MKLFSVAVTYRLKSKSYWSQPARASVQAGNARLAAGRAIARLGAPKGSRVEEYSITITDLGTVTEQKN